MTSYFNFLLLS